MKKFKLFLIGHFDKEEEWLNKMSSLGHNLKFKKGFIYDFKEDVKMYFFMIVTFKYNIINC